MFFSTNASSERGSDLVATPASRWLWLPFAVGALLLTVLIMKGRLYAASTDLFQHYELTHALTANWAWPGGTALSTGMQAYPPLAHYLGAMAGLPFGSALMGMNVVAVSAIFLCYLLLARTLTVSGPAAVAVAAVIAAAGLWLARSHHTAEGFEIYSNYFYAQLVGEAVFLTSVLWLSDDKRPWLLRWAVAAALTFACCFLYLIAAVEIALAYLALEAMLLARRVAAERTFRPAWCLPILTGVATLPWLIYFNPYFRNMITVSNHDGALVLPGLPNIVPGLAAVLLVVGLLLGLTPPKADPRRRQLQFLAVACCATASAALAQMIVFEVAKIGSPYAVKKYTFSVATLLAFGLAALVSGWLDGRRPRRSWPVLAIGLPPVFALVATVAMPPSTPDRLNRFVAYQKSVRALLRDPRTPRDAFGNTMSMNDDFSPFLNLAFTVVDLGMGQAKGMSAFGITSPQTPGTYVLWKAAGDDLADSCTAAVPGFIPVVLTKVNCGPMSSGELQFAQDMSKVSILPRYFGSGWSVKEPNGVWSDGPKAQIATHFDRPPGSLRMTIKASAYIPKAGYVQHILVSAGGAPLTEWSFDAKEPTGVRQVVIPASQIVDGDLKMDFAFPDAVRPNAPGNPGAARQLGIFLTEISMENLRRLGPGDSIKLGKVFLSPPFLTAGWSEKTQTGTGVWSVGRKSSMLLSINEGDWDPVVVLEGNAFLPTPGYSQRVIVRVGSNVVAQWTLDAKSAGKPLSIAVPRRLAKGGEIALDFEFPDATSPAAHNQPGDSRDLGFFVTSVGLKAATRAPT